MQSPTSKAEEYLRRAIENENRANNTIDPKLKASFRKVAQQYRQLAVQAERMHKQDIEEE